MVELIQKIEEEWFIDSGFFGLLRNGQFSEEGFQNLLSLLDRVDSGDSENIDRRLVSLLWYMPRFMDWQKERLESRGISSDRVDSAITEVENRLEEILGVP